MKKSFTIIELVVVMVILSLMLLMGRNLFTSENKIYFQGETCINNMYNQIDDLHLASLLSRERFLTGGSSSALNIINPEWIGILFRFPALYVGGGTIGTGIDIRGVPSLGNIRSQGSGWSTSWTGVTTSTQNVRSVQNFFRGTGEAPGVLTGGTRYQYDATQLPLFKTISTGFRNLAINCLSNEYFVTTDNDFNAPAVLLTFQNETISNNITQKMKLAYTHDINNSSLYVQAYTGAINFNVCNRRIQCRQTYRMFFDTRVNNVFLQKCNQYDPAGKCTDRQGGNIN